MDLSFIKEMYASDKAPSAGEVARRLGTSEKYARNLITKAGVRLRDHKRLYCTKKCRLCGESHLIAVRAYYCDECRKIKDREQSKAQQLLVKENAVRKRPKSNLRKCHTKGCERMQVNYWCDECRKERAGGENVRVASWTSGVLRMVK